MKREFLPLDGNAQLVFHNQHSATAAFILGMVERYLWPPALAFFTAASAFLSSVSSHRHQTERPQCRVVIETLNSLPFMAKGASNTFASFFQPGAQFPTRL